MSTTPVPPPATNPAPNKLSGLVLGGIIVGVIVVCSGMSAMSLATVLTLGRSTQVASSTESAPSSQRTTPSTEDGTEDTGQRARDVAHKFMTALKGGRYDEAYNLSSDKFQNGEPQADFRARVSELKAIRGHTTARYTRRPEDGKVSFTISVDGPNGQGRFSMVVALENGSWKVDSFGD